MYSRLNDMHRAVWCGHGTSTFCSFSSHGLVLLFRYIGAPVDFEELNLRYGQLFKIQSTQCMSCFSMKSLYIIMIMRIGGSSTQEKEGHIWSKRYGGPQLSHQNKMLTSNSNHSQQIQITHSKFNSLTANYKSTTVNEKLFTSNSNRSQQILIRSVYVFPL